ncbi:hypothetical protein SAMN05421763_101103 [[Luteovulum] sphaeroides subsp. megalophilum]|uniref:hypothetical protein n=1 Tax=Cereibacter sphaeroides TaxID=1063 RepID=UPI000B647968|nr:hypothetical protein [Cereibacter sphaeroides]SNS14667.1 hypothetical protein SAMN05421763_101103 [[Luteovulum] sphaeroides subsp. megalophilum]
MSRAVARPSAASLAVPGLRVLGEAADSLRQALPSRSARVLAGLRLGMIGDAASDALGGALRAMGASVASVALDGRRMPADRRPDAVVISWPGAAGTAAAEWEQVALMKLDNPRLIVVLLDGGRGLLEAPDHDLRIPRGSPGSEIRAALAELRRLRREQRLAASARSDVGAPVCSLFRRPTPSAQGVSLFAHAA